MSDVTLQASAIDQIMGDDDVRRWLKDRAGDRVPYLGYFRRCYSTYNDGSVVEHGVGFGLSTINPHDPKETSGIVIKPVKLTPDADILVGGGEEIMSTSFSIGWSKWRFTYQPDWLSILPSTWDLSAGDAHEGGFTWRRGTEMNQEEEQLLTDIQDAFADRSMPAGRLIEDGVDLSYHLEAQRVDEYFRKNKAVIDRHNSVIAAFIYMNTNASFWLLPLYMKSIIADYKRDDFLIDVFFNVLAGDVSPYKKSPGDRDLDMRKMATDQEADVVCRFCRWLKLKQDMPAIVDEYSDTAIAVWCTRP